MQPQDDSGIFEWLKFIPLLIVWVIVFLLDNVSKQRVPRHPQNKTESKSHSSNNLEQDPEKLLQEWKDALLGKHTDEKNEDIELDYGDEDLEEETLEPILISKEERGVSIQKSSLPENRYPEEKSPYADRFSKIEEQQIESAIENRSLNSSFESSYAGITLNSGIAFNSPFEKSGIVPSNHDHCEELKEISHSAKRAVIQSKKQLILAFEMFQPPVSMRRNRL